MKNFSETDMKIKVAEAVPNYGQKNYQKDTEFLDEIHKTVRIVSPISVVYLIKSRL